LTATAITTNARFSSYFGAIFPAVLLLSDVMHCFECYLA